MSFWVGWCSPDYPDAEQVFRALCKPEVMERAEVTDAPAWPVSS